jgi:hypothetical protein
MFLSDIADNFRKPLGVILKTQPLICQSRFPNQEDYFPNGSIFLPLGALQLARMAERF